MFFVYPISRDEKEVHRVLTLESKDLDSSYSKQKLLLYCYIIFFSCKQKLLLYCYIIPVLCDLTNLKVCRRQEVTF